MIEFSFIWTLLRTLAIGITWFLPVISGLSRLSPNLVEMLFSMIPMQCLSQNLKLENFGYFLVGLRTPDQWGGGVVPHIRTEGKKTHTCKKNFEKLKNSPECHFF